MCSRQGVSPHFNQRQKKSYVHRQKGLKIHVVSAPRSSKITSCRFCYWPKGRRKPKLLRTKLRILSSAHHTPGDLLVLITCKVQGFRSESTHGAVSMCRQYSSSSARLAGARSHKPPRSHASGDHMVGLETPRTRWHHGSKVPHPTRQDMLHRLQPRAEDNPTSPVTSKLWVFPPAVCDLLACPILTSLSLPDRQGEQRSCPR